MVPGVRLILRWAVLVVAAILAFGATAHAQRGPGVAASGGTITGVQIQGNVRAEPETIRSYLQLKEGEPYDAAAADRSLKALFGTGLFSDVTIDMQGSTLVVKVTENPIINRVAFEGNRKIEDDKLRDEVQSRPRQVFTRARVQSDVERILTIYRRSGRYNASVEPKVIKLEQGRVDLVFEINEGDKTGVKDIEFVGNKAYSSSRLKDVIKTGGEWVSSLELENIISQHPAVSEVAVIGVKDDKWGERPLAMVVLKPGQTATADEIKATVAKSAEAGHISRYAVPDEIRFVEELARTSVGKINKKAIREHLA